MCVVLERSCLCGEYVSLSYRERYICTHLQCKVDSDIFGTAAGLQIRILLSDVRRMKQEPKLKDTTMRKATYSVKRELVMREGLSMREGLYEYIYIYIYI